MATDPQPRVVCDIKDAGLADSGKRRIEWAFQSMPVLQMVRKQFIKLQPLKDVAVSACLHVNPETANFLIALRDGGAHVVLCAAHPHSTQDEVAAALVRDYGIAVFAVRGSAPEIHKQHLQAAVERKPTLVIDDASTIAVALQHDASGIAGGIEGEAGTARPYPVIVVRTRYGADQSVLDGIVRQTEMPLAARTVVVAGYGALGSGIAARARGMGAHVIVTEIDPVRAVEALMNGFRVMSMMEAAALGEIFITACTARHVISRDHFDKLRNGAIICRSQFGEDLEALARMASSHRLVRDFVEEFAFRDGRRIYVLSAAGQGWAASISDLRFSAEALAAEYLLKHAGKLENTVRRLPEELDKMVARLKLESIGVKIDRVPL